MRFCGVPSLLHWSNSLSRSVKWGSTAARPLATRRTQTRRCQGTISAKKHIENIKPVSYESSKSGIKFFLAIKKQDRWIVGDAKVQTKLSAGSSPEGDHPFTKVHDDFRKVFDVGFKMIPIHMSVESSFWNLGKLFQPQPHPRYTRYFLKDLATYWKYSLAWKIWTVFPNDCTACFCDMARMKKGLVDRQPRGSRVRAGSGLRTQVMSTRNDTAPKLATWYIYRFFSGWRR
ncbi:MAG: hypothetical protein J3Q66DRAFT_70283 [Benniella sp.]|nr:MAG: hypothetical protein J3Q66DRAFT_70283 [Benniella sp.]